MRQRGQTSVRSRGRGEEHEDRLPSDVEVTTAARLCWLHWISAGQIAG